MVWKLKRGLYGLKDGARQFYLSVREELVRIGFLECEVDPAVYWNRKLQGLICYHVDDFLHAGNESFEERIKQLRDRFSAVKIEEKYFQYIGFQMIQTDDVVIVDQSKYVESIELEHIEPCRTLQSDSQLNETELTKLRQIVGKINWVVQSSRPDMAFEMIFLNTKLKNGKVKDLIRARKTLCRLKNSKYFLMFRKLLNVSGLSVVAFTDASLGNINDGTGSTCAYTIWWVDNAGNCCPITWQANKIRRVVRSTIAAEA